MRLPIRLFSLALLCATIMLLTYCSAKGGKQPTGGGGGNNGDGAEQNTNSGDAGQTNDPGQQNVPVNDPDAGGPKQLPPPDGGPGYGRPNFSNGIPPGMPNQTRPQVEPISNPHPNVSSAQGCTMQRQSSFSGGGSGLRLDDSGINQVVAAPPSVSLWVNRGSGDRKTTTHCSGVLSMREYPNIALDDPGVSKDGPKNKVSGIFFPRISLATHCIGSTDASPIKEIILVSTTDPTRQTVISGNQFFSNIAISQNKLFDFSEFKQSSTKDDPCTIKVKATGDTKSPCFTLGADQVDLITKREEAFIRAYFFKRILTPFGLGEFYETAGNWLRKSGNASATEINWLDEYAEGEAKNVTTLALDDHQQIARGFKSSKEAMEYFNRSLLAITTTRPTRKPSEALLPFIISRPNTPGGWADILEVFGTNRAVDRNPDNASKEVFIISSVRLKEGRDYGFKQGDSGIWLIGEFLEANAPLLTVRSFREVMGVLSTVGGVDVCAGDDLLCCDRS